MTEADWTDFYISQANRAAAQLRWVDRRLSRFHLDALRDTKRWMDEALEKAEALEDGKEA